jgi:hypothetical protein
VRRLRTLLRSGSLSRVDYERLIDQQVAFAIGVQEALGLDVLVHGEPEVGRDGNGVNKGGVQRPWDCVRRLPCHDHFCGLAHVGET